MMKSANNPSEMYFILLRHSYFLRSSINLWFYRQRQLQQTIGDLGLSDSNLSSDDITLIQRTTANEIGGVNARMTLDAPEEIMKYDFGTLQMALCFLYEIMKEYDAITKIFPVFFDNDMKNFCYENFPKMNLLKGLRNSIIHPRADNQKFQRLFLDEFNKGTLLVEFVLQGQSIFENLLIRVSPLIEKWRQI